jgi:hypothetical protein
MIAKTGSAAGLRRIGAAEALCEARLAMGRVTLALSELAAETGLSAIAAKRQLSRLGEKVVRVSPRQPFFLIVAPEHRVMGAPPASWWLEDYFAWLGRPYYLALQSAASEFGASPQAVQVTQVMTDRPIRPIAVGRIRVTFFVKREIECTATLLAAGAAAPLRVSTPEATAYDLSRPITRQSSVYLGGWSGCPRPRPHFRTTHTQSCPSGTVSFTTGPVASAAAVLSPVRGSNRVTLYAPSGARSSTQSFTPRA